MTTTNQTLCKPNLLEITRRTRRTKKLGKTPNDLALEVFNELSDNEEFSKWKFEKYEKLNISYLYNETRYILRNFLYTNFFYILEIKKDNLEIEINFKNLLKRKKQIIYEKAKIIDQAVFHIFNQPKNPSFEASENSLNPFSNKTKEPFSVFYDKVNRRLERKAMRIFQILLDNKEFDWDVEHSEFSICFFNKKLKIKFYFICTFLKIEKDYINFNICLQKLLNEKKLTDYQKAEIIHNTLIGQNKILKETYYIITQTKNNKNKVIY